MSFAQVAMAIVATSYVLVALSQTSQPAPMQMQLSIPVQLSQGYESQGAQPVLTPLPPKKKSRAKTPSTTTNMPAPDNAAVLRAALDNSNQTLAAVGQVSSQALTVSSNTVAWIKDVYSFWLTIIGGFLAAASAIGGWIGFTAVKTASTEAARNRATTLIEPLSLELKSLKEMHEQEVNRLQNESRSTLEKTNATLAEQDVLTKEMGKLLNEINELKSEASDTIDASICLTYGLTSIVSAEARSPRGEETKEEATEAALHHWNEAIKWLGIAQEKSKDLAPSMKYWLLANNAYALKKVGEVAKALECILKAVELQPENPIALYNAACYANLLGNVAQALTQIRALLDQIKEAETLKVWIADIRKDDDLITLHGNPDFEALLNRSN